ncbi:MAG TPA: NUDIX domain-containing protein [Solirubrobacteraceae bacterium]|nr:NUDIX domain-containing protein [Solirubrobacteraceae bacterium]
MSSKGSKRPRGGATPEGSERRRKAAAGEAAKRRRKAAAPEVSAGGVVMRGGQVLVVVPVRRAADGSRVLGLPKGHVDPGESALQAATREVREEGGVVAEPLGELGEVRYFYRRDGRTVPKSVAFFLFRYVSGETSDHDHEIEDARWIDLREARTALSYEGERRMIARALERLREGSEPAGS